MIGDSYGGRIGGKEAPVARLPILIGRHENAHLVGMQPEEGREPARGRRKIAIPISLLKPFVDLVQRLRLIVLQKDREQNVVLGQSRWSFGRGLRMRNPRYSAYAKCNNSVGQKRRDIVFHGLRSLQVSI